jgi:hypothetical protein
MLVRTKTLFLLLLISTPAMAQEKTVVKVSMLGAPWVVPVAPTANYLRTLRVIANRKISLTANLTTPFLGDVTGEEATLSPESTALDLEPNVPKLVRLTFSKVPHAEVYRGVIEIRSKSPVRKIVEAALQLDARVRPELAAPALKSFSRVRKGADWLACILLGDEAKNPKIELRVQSNKAQRVQLRATDAVVVGETSGREIGCVVTEVSCKNKSGELGVVRVALNIDRDNLPADKYTGSVLLLSTEPDATAVSVPVEILVRAAPVLPLLLIIIGVILGLIVKWMEEKGNRQAELIVRLERIQSALNADDHLVLAGEIDKARQQIYLTDVTNAETTVTGLERRADAVRRIDRWIEELGTSGATVPELITDLEDARKAVIVTPDELRLTDLETKVRAALVQAVQSRGIGQNQRTTSRARSIGARIAAIQDDFRRLRAESAPLIRWSLYVLTVIALIYAGLSTLYVSNATFGANGLGDYAALLLWGIGADVAGKTLSGVGSLLKR